MNFREDGEAAKERQNSAPADSIYELRLYVAGHTPRSLEAFANLKNL